MPDSKLVALSQALPDPPPLEGISHHDSPLSWVLTAAGLSLGALFWARRRVSRDGAEIAKDRAETNIVEVLRQERDKAMQDAREAWARRTADAEQIATLRTENEYLKRDVSSLREEVKGLHEIVGALRKEFAALSGRQPLAQMPSPTTPA